MSSAFNEPQSELGLGFHYFIYGWRLMLQRRLMPFVRLGGLDRQLYAFLAGLADYDFSTACRAFINYAVLFYLYYHYQLYCRPV